MGIMVMTFLLKTCQIRAAWLRRDLDMRTRFGSSIWN